MKEQIELYDIAVVGAGIVGSSVAVALAQALPNRRIIMLDAGPGAAPLAEHAVANGVADFDPRVVALTRDSEQLLDRIGVWPKLRDKRLCPYTDMQVWDGDGSARISFNADAIGQPNLGHIVENKLVVLALAERAHHCQNLTVQNHCAVASINNQHGLQQLCLAHNDDGASSEIKASMVLACDGAQSALRQMQNISTRQWDYGHEAIVTTVQTAKPHLGMARQRFMTTGPLAYLPLARESESHPQQQNICSIVWSCVPERAQALMALDDSAFAQQLAQALEFELGEVEQVAKRFSIPLRQRHANTYIQPGFALAGDAAHTIHPLAGQGVNLGLKDVAALIEQITRADARGLDLSDFSILRRYQRQRMADNLAMMATMEGFKHLFACRDIRVRWLRNEGMRRVNSLSALKNKIVRQAMGL